eukprot:403362639
MKPSVDNRSPKYNISQNGDGGDIKSQTRGNSRKKNIMRKREIETENNALIQKMLQIMQRGVRSSSTSPMSGSKKLQNYNQSIGQFIQNPQYLPGGGVIANSVYNQPYTPSNQNIANPSINIQYAQQQNMMKNHPSQSNFNIQMNATAHSQQVSPSKIGSLNYQKRKKDINNINQTNKQLLRALQNVKATVNRDEMRNHEKRIMKLKQHIGQVRYGSPMNFLFPQVDNENHNFHSSQFVFVKNPSQINLKSARSQARKQSRDNLNQTQQYFNNQMNQQVRPNTSQGGARVKKQRNNHLNQSADFTQLNNPLSQYIQVHRYLPTQQNQIQMKNNENLKNELQIMMEPSQSQNGDDLNGTSRQSVNNNYIAATGAIDEQVSGKNSKSSKLQMQSSYSQYSKRALTPSVNQFNQTQQFNNTQQQFNANNNQPQRKLRSRQNTSQSAVRLNKKDLQIISSYQPNLMAHQFANLQFNTSQNGMRMQTPLNYQYQQQNVIQNPYVATSAQKEKFVKPQSTKNQQILFQNIMSTPQTQKRASQSRTRIQVPIPSASPKINSKSFSKIQESSIKFIQPIININRADDSMDLNTEQQKIEFYNSQMMNIEGLNQSPTSNLSQLDQSPQFLTDFASSSKNVGSPIKLNFDSNIQSSPVINLFAQPQILINHSSGGNTAAQLMRTNTKYTVPTDQQQQAKNILGFNNQQNTNKKPVMQVIQESIQKISQNQQQSPTKIKDKTSPTRKPFIEQELKNDLSKTNSNLKQKADFAVKSNKVISAIKNQKDVRENAEQKANEFIQILRQKIVDRKALLLQMKSKDSENKEVKQFFSQIFSMPQSSPDTMSVKYSDDSFELGDQANSNIPAIENKEELQKYLKDNEHFDSFILQQKKEEEDILKKAENIINSLKDQMLQEKIKKKIDKFVSVLKERAIEAKQKQIVRRMFAKQLTSAVKQSIKKKEITQKILSVAEEDAIQSQVISNFQNSEKQQENKNQQKFIDKLKASQVNSNSIKDYFGQMTPNSRLIIIRFFQVIWKRVNVKKLVKSFVNILKISVQNSKLRKFNKMITRIYSQQMNKGLASRIIGHHIKSNEHLNEKDSMSLSYSGKDRSVSTPKQLDKVQMEGKSMVSKNFIDKVAAKSREQNFLMKMRQDIRKSIQSQIVEITDEERARLNASNFIDALKFNSSTKRGALKLARLFVFILKRRVKERNKLTERAVKQMRGPKKSTDQTMTTVFSFSNKRKISGRDFFSIKHLRSEELWAGIYREFRRLFCNLFQRNKQKRSSKIFKLYPVMEFKQRVLLLMQRDLKLNMGKKDEEQFLYKKLQCFIFINNLKNKHMKYKGYLKSQEYKQRMVYFYKRRQNQAVKFKQIMMTSKDKMKELKFFICKIFLQRTYNNYIRYNPFRFNVLYLRDVRHFIANLFQNKRDLIGRPRNIFKIIGYTPSLRQVKLFIAKQFQLKNPSSLIIQKAKNAMHQINKAKVVNKFADKLKQGASTNQMNSQAQKNEFKLQEVAQSQISEQFKKLFCKLFQLNQQQRESQIYNLYAAREFYIKTVGLIRQHFKAISQDKSVSKDYSNSLKAFLVLNEIKIKLQKQSGLNKAKLLIYKLRLRVKRNANIKQQINYFVNQKSNSLQKIRMIKYSIAKLFQQKSYQAYCIYNPFYNCLNKQQFIKYFIANVFQNNQNLLGRPLNIFKKYEIPSERQIRLFIAKQFQIKSFEDTQQSRQIQNTKNLGLGQVKQQQKSIKSIVNMMKIKPKVQEAVSAQIKDEQVWKDLSSKTKILLAQMFQLKENERETRIFMIYKGQEYISHVLSIMQNYALKIQQIDHNTSKRIKAYVFLNQLRQKYAVRKGQLKYLEYIYRLRFFARKNINNRAMVKQNLTQCKYTDQKFQAIKRFMAHLFQQRSFNGQLRYNPFTFNNLTIKQVKLFIADLFQNKRDLVGRPRNVFLNPKAIPSQKSIKRFIALQFQKKNYLRKVSNFTAKLRKFRVQRIVKRFVQIFKDKLIVQRNRHNDIAVQMMRMLNLQLQQRSDDNQNNYTKTQKEINIYNDDDEIEDHSDLIFKEGPNKYVIESMSIGHTESDDQNYLTQEFLKKEQEDEVNSLAGDSFSNEEEKELLRKMLNDAKSHVQESKQGLQRKVSMYKNNIKNNLANNFLKKIKDGQSLQIVKNIQSKTQQANQNQSTQGNLKMLAMALKQQKQENQKAQQHAMSFVQAIKDQKDESERKDINVKKFVNNMMLQKKEGRARIINDADDEDYKSDN